MLSLIPQSLTTNHLHRMPDATEITTRSPSNHWIVGKRFEDREVYMIVSRKDSTLVEVEGKCHTTALKSEVVLDSLCFSLNLNIPCTFYVHR